MTQVQRRPVTSDRGVTIIDAMNDPHLFAGFFRNARTWSSWRAFLAALFALLMSPTEAEIYQQCTGRTTLPTMPVNEAWLVIGRRGGKSFILALVAVFTACFKDWRCYLGPGERGTVMVVACDRKQSRVIMRYVKGLITNVPMLAPLIASETQESIDLSNRVTIEVHVASFRSTRGYAVVAALLDELAFWPTDETSAEPDVEIINAIRPGMATIPGAILLCASSPYARKGALWNVHQKHFAKDNDPILVWQAATRIMNPSVSQRVVDQAIEDDPARAFLEEVESTIPRPCLSEFARRGNASIRPIPGMFNLIEKRSSAGAEYGAQFRTDVEAFVGLEQVQACVQRGVYEHAPQTNITYSAFVDPSGGRNDAMTMAIAHQEYTKETIVIDCIREVKPPFSPEAVVAEFASVLRTYRIDKVVGDRYAGEWPREQFSKFGIRYEAAAKPKSDLYTNALALINSRRISLIGNPRLVSQLVGLERRTARGGKDSINHSLNSQDDICNSVAGVASLCITKAGYTLDALCGDLPDDSETSAADFRKARLAAYIASYIGR